MLNLRRVIFPHFSNFCLMRYTLVALLGSMLAISACTKEPVEPEPDPISFTLSTLSASETGNGKTADEINPKSVLTNTSGRAIQLKWVRYDVNVPEEWEVAVCDDEACHIPTVGSRVMDLSDGEVVEMKITFRPNGMEGTGTAKLVMFDPADSAATAQVVNFTAIGE